MFDGFLMSNTCAPPFPKGLSRPGSHEEPGGTTPPPRSSVTNMKLPRWCGSASCDTDTPSSERTNMLLLQVVTGAPASCGNTQSRPGWLNVPRNLHPRAEGGSGPGSRQSVTLARVASPSATVHASGVPRTFPLAFVRSETSKIRVALSAAQ